MTINTTVGSNDITVNLDEQDVKVTVSDKSTINVEVSGGGSGIIVEEGGTQVGLTQTLDFVNALDATSKTGKIQIDVESGGINTDELDLNITPIWTGKHQFDSGLDTRGDIEDDTTVIYDSSGGHVEQSILENDSVTVAGNSVSLGGSTTVSIDDLLDVSSSSESAGEVPIWNSTNTEYENSTLTGGTNISITNADGSITIVGDVTELSNLNDASISTPSAGQLIIYDATDSQFENASLTGGNAISVTGADASVTLDVDSDSIGTDELVEDLIYGTELASGTVTASGGSSPAVNTTLTGITTNQLADYIVVVKVDSDPTFSADYAFNYDYSQIWDDSDGQIDIELTVNWDTDPGSGNDVSLKYRVIERT